MATGTELALYTGGMLAAAFLPPLLYTVWVRNLEEHAPEPWGSLFRAFAWGATGGVVLALVLEVLLGVRPDALTSVGVSAAVLTAVVVAPVVEEATKVLGLRWIDDAHIEVEDGLVYGAAAGFGFAATENLVYGAAALMEGGVADLVATMVLRSISSAFLHGAASALVGFAIWQRRAGEGTTGRVLGLYGVAVLLHAAYNLGASVQLALAFVGSMVLALWTFGWVRKRVIALDQRRTPRSW